MVDSQRMKLTSIGSIPDDWDAIPLSKVGVFGKGSGVTRANAQSGNIPCVRYGEIYTSHNDFIKAFYSHISPEIASTATKLKKGDILFAGSGETKEEIGKAVAFLGNEEAYAGGDIIILSPNMESSSMYLGYVLNSKAAVAQKASMGQGDAVVHIHAKELADVVIPWPKVDEQERIADALSTIDALITGLDEAIEKKRQIKEGLMQNLLTGRKRLSKNEGWQESTLGQLAEICKGVQFDSSLFTEGGRYPMLNGGITPSGYSEFFNTEAETITISEGGNSCGYVNYMTERFWCGGHCYSLKVNGLVDKLFLYQLLKFNEKAIMALRVGSGLPNVQGKALYDFSLKYPISIEEQRAISEILNKADQEILAVESQRDKYILIKQGMMQELLTGKTRLI